MRCLLHVCRKLVADASDRAKKFALLQRSFKSNEEGMRAQVEAAQLALAAQQATTAEALSEAASARERAEAAERLAEENARAVASVQVHRVGMGWVKGGDHIRWLGVWQWQLMSIDLVTVGLKSCLR
jgi:hypothetical protein